MKFDEQAFEEALIRLLEEEGYTHTLGAELARDKRTVLLEDDLCAYLRGRYGELTEAELRRLMQELSHLPGSPYEANRLFIRRLQDGFIFKRDEATAKDLYISLLDFEEPGKNIWRVVNQLEVQGYEELRRPDVVVFVNGLPLVVMELKSASREEATLLDAYKQLTVRYRRDIPDLFTYNVFVVLSDGTNSRYGSLFSPYEFFYSWSRVNSGDKTASGVGSLLTLVKGLFAPERLLAVLHDFVYVPDSSPQELKIVCRYPQFFAARALFSRILKHRRPLGDGKGGTYFGTTGCGKSYTMLFLSRMLMRSEELESPTLVIITDRTDLDSQLASIFTMSKSFIGDEHIVGIESREALREELKGRTSGGVYLTTIQKFSEGISLLSERSNIICISDEAHRSQLNLEQSVRVTSQGVQKKYGFAKYLHSSLPNATYVGFTGTPIDETIKVFGKIVERYTMTESVADGITVNLVYEGRAARVSLDAKKLEAVEEYYAKCLDEGASEYQVERSKKEVAQLEAVLGDMDRLRAVAKDFIAHYERRLSEGATVAGKAMFVCFNRKIAYEFYKILLELRPEWGEKRLAEGAEALTEAERKKQRPIERVRMVMTRNKDDEPALYKLLGTKEDRQELDRQFKDVRSNFKIAIVVDMWLTGFDVPCLDTMYIDKPLQKHTLIQTISRVNRVYEGKEKGLIVDYIGIKKAMGEALRRYTDFVETEFEGTDKALKVLRDQLEVLKGMLLGFDTRDYFTGDPKAQLLCLKGASEFIQTTKDLETRFMAASKRLKDAYALCSTSEELTEGERDQVYFYQAVRSLIFKLTKGDAPDLAQMNAKVRDLVQEAIISDGVEELFTAGKQVETDLFSEQYLESVMKIKLPNTRIKMLEKLIAGQVEEYKRVNRIKGLEFSERLERIIREYNNRRHDKALANDVLNDVMEQLTSMLEDIKADKDVTEKMGIDFEEKAFFDILKAVRDKHNFEFAEDKLIELAKEMKDIVADKAQYPDWADKEDIKASLKVDLVLLMDKRGYPPVTIDDVYKEILEQAENFKKNMK